MKRKHLVLFWAVGLSTAAFWSLGFSGRIGGTNYTLNYVDNNADTTFEANSTGSAASNAVDANGNSVGHALAVPSGGTASTFGSGIRLVAGTTKIETNANGHVSVGRTAVLNCQCVDNGLDVDIFLTKVSGNISTGLVDQGPLALGAAENVTTNRTFSIGGADGDHAVDPFAASITVACPPVGNSPPDCGCPTSCPI